MAFYLWVCGYLERRARHARRVERALELLTRWIRNKFVARFKDEAQEGESFVFQTGSDRFTLWYCGRLHVDIPSRWLVDVFLKSDYMCVLNTIEDACNDLAAMVRKDRAKRLADVCYPVKPLATRYDIE